jgi:hypothetical protein
MTSQLLATGANIGQELLASLGLQDQRVTKIVLTVASQQFVEVEVTRELTVEQALTGIEPLSRYNLVPKE